MSDQARIAENWRPIVGYEGLYEVSDHGQVRRLDRVITVGDRQVLWRGLFDQMASGIRTACGPYVRLPEWFGGPYPVSSVLMPDGSLSTERYKSSPLAGVQRAASPEGVSDETPDTPPPSGHTDAELLLAAAAVIEMDGADMLTELAADLRKRAADLTSDKGIKLT